MVLITDPAFYAVAVPAAFLMGLAKAGLAGGLGGLAVPLMALAIPVPQAAAIMLPLLMAADVMGLSQLVRHTDWRLIRLLLPPGLAGIVLGAVLFRWMPAAAVSGVVGVVTLAFVVIRVAFPPQAEAAKPSPRAGRLLASISGFTSFVAHAGNPPISFYMLPLRLAPLTFAATMSVFFAAINFSKWVPYALLGLIDGRNMLTSLVLLPVPLVGVWVGLRIVRRIPQSLFERLVVLGMTAAGLKLTWDGLAFLGGG